MSTRVLQTKNEIQSRGTAKYDQLYSDSAQNADVWCWKGDVDEKKSLVAKTIVGPSGWPENAKILEIGCGLGESASFLSEMGFQVTAIDLSKVGIQHARQTYNGPEYICADAAEFEPDCMFDGILASGMSWYHYELSDVNCNGVDVPKETARLFRLLKPGGTFVLKIKTDFSGRRPLGKVHHNRLADYMDLFTPLGTIIRTTDGSGRLLRTEQDAKPTWIRKMLGSTREGVVIVTQKG